MKYLVEIRTRRIVTEPATDVDGGEFSWSFEVEALDRAEAEAKAAAMLGERRKGRAHEAPHDRN